jgi:hypothetical protein
MRLTDKMTRKRTDKSHEYAISDAAAAYIADALMELALQFEAKHFAQIRRHYQSMTPELDNIPSQRDLFGEHPTLNSGRRKVPPRADHRLASGRRR